MAHGDAAVLYGAVECCSSAVECPVGEMYAGYLVRGGSHAASAVWRDDELWRERLLVEWFWGRGGRRRFRGAEKVGWGWMGWAGCDGPSPRAFGVEDEEGRCERNEELRRHMTSRATSII